jgi:hypothetical protein
MTPHGSHAREASSASVTAVVMALNVGLIGWAPTRKARAWLIRRGGLDNV